MPRTASDLATFPARDTRTERAAGHNPRPAYPVPWSIDRDRAPWYALRNLGDEPAHAVQLSLLGDGRLLWQPLVRVEPGERLVFVLRAHDAPRDCIAVLRWFRPDGEEYLWRIAF